MMDDASRQELSEAYAFIGNSLLKPISMTASVGLESEFWKAWPTFDDAQIVTALEACAQYACVQEKRASEGVDIVERCAVEYTKLFVGPPSPAAPPWETMNLREGVTIGFGEATFQMKALLRDVGLGLSNENNQYEDHLGIELLYLSELCRQSIACEDAGDFDAKARAFIDEHPLKWLDTFRGRVEAAYPEGYYACLLGLLAAVLMWHKEQLS